MRIYSERKMLTFTIGFNVKPSSFISLSTECVLTLDPCRRWNCWGSVSYWLPSVMFRSDTKLFYVWETFLVHSKSVTQVYQLYMRMLPDHQWSVPVETLIKGVRMICMLPFTCLCNGWLRNGRCRSLFFCRCVFADASDFPLTTNGAN